MLLVLCTSPVSYARVKVHDREELKRALASTGTEVIELAETITVRETLVVRGRKTLTGPGELRRAVTENSGFGGSLLSVRGEAFRLQGVTIDGRGDSPALSGRLYGWLVEVNSGQLTIGGGADLRDNKNSSRKSDGGGAVRIHGGGVCVLDGGTIRNNTCVTGGAGVRIDSGGVFYMKSGQITGNRVCGVGAVEGFDGRGGGVLNRGTAGFYGGSVSSNTVTGVHEGGRDYGGVGGGLANAGSCILKGTVIRGNTGGRGKDIGAIGGKLTADGTVSVGEIWLRDGQVLHVGNGFRSGEVIRLVPERIASGVELVCGWKGEDWKKAFSVEGKLGEKDLTVRLKNGVLSRRERPEPTPTPTPVSTAVPSVTSTSTPTPGGSSRISPVHTVASVLPSYLPVSTPDPEAEITLATLAPTPVPSLAPTASPSETPSPTPSPTPSAVPTSSPVSHGRSLPWYLIYPMEERKVVPTMGPNRVKKSSLTPPEVTTGSSVKVTMVETSHPASTWHFSREEIRAWKKEFREKGLRYDETSCREFMEEIRANGK